MKMESQTIILRAFDRLRFPLMVMVVFLHYSPGYEVGPLMTPPYLTEFNTTFFVFIKVLCQAVVPRVAVPAFFVISGYLFFLRIKSFDLATYKYKVRRRFSSLFIPYLIWNVVAIMYPLSLHLFRGETMPSDVWGYLAYLWDTGEPLHTPLNYPLWYMRDLIVLTILSPLIYHLLKYLKGFFILLLFACYVTGFSTHITSLGVTSALYFSLGAYYSVFEKDVFAVEARELLHMKVEKTFLGGKEIYSRP